MQSSKHNKPKPLTPADVEQLMTAVSDLNQRINYLSKLLQTSLRAQAQSEAGLDDEQSEPAKAPKKIMH